MFKLDKEEYTTRNIRIPVSLLERLNTVAQEKNMSVNKLITKCCEYALDNLEED